VKQIALTKFKGMSAKAIKSGPCLEVIADGAHVGFLIVGAEMGMRDKVAGIASQIDAGRGK